MTDSSPRVVVLGGGMAGLAAAWQLSAGDWRADYESITVYQRGHRLGGKGASSRGVNGRIEEHGLHVWLGYYDNAFALMRDCYGELDRRRTDPACPIRTCDEAFIASGRVGVADGAGDEWTTWIADFAENEMVPGDRSNPARDMNPLELVRRGTRLLIDFSRSMGSSQPEETPRPTLSASPVPPRSRPPVVDERRELYDLLRQAEMALVVGASTATGALRAGADRLGPLPWVAPLVEHLDRLGGDAAKRMGNSDEGRRIGQLIDLVVTAVRGVISDDLIRDPRGFGAVDHLDFREWLAAHGAQVETLDSPLLRGMYDLVFGYRHGDAASPRFAAGLGLFLSSKMFFDYKGAIFWKMRAGMGDVVFAPLYQALRARGVDFQFFHRVDRLCLSSDHGELEAVELARQAELRPELDHYDPLVDVGGLPCFPAEPLIEQFAVHPPVDAEAHSADRVTESPVRIESGVDFDVAVLAVSLGMVPHVGQELIEHVGGWRELIDNVETVATEALQLWMRPTEAELGWCHPGVTVSGYRKPFDTYASMSHLLPVEHWPAGDAPGSVAYFCSVLPDAPGDDGSAADDRVARDVERLLAGPIGHFWPAAVDETGGVDPDLVVGSHVRANTDPSDRYVQSLPNSGRHRLRADGAGVRGLVLAGDWVDCGLNAGCIEAAVMSGIQAANAIGARPLRDGILGRWLPYESSSDDRA